MERLLEHQRPVRPVGAALTEGHVRLPQRAVGAELESAAVDEGAVGKNDFVAVAHRHAGCWLDVGADRGELLNGLAEGEEVGAAQQPRGADDVGAEVALARVGLEAEAIHDFGDEGGAFASLSHYHWGIEETLIQQPRLAERRPAIHARRRQPMPRSLDVDALADDVAAAWGKGAAGVLNEASCNKIRTDLRKV